VVEHCWEKPWHVTIRELLVLGRSQSVLITSDFMAGLLSLTSLQNFGPHLPPPSVQRVDIKKGHHFQWIEREKVINRGIDEQAILEANKPPSGQWETEEAIRRSLLKYNWS
jgi:hypothetical protein